MTKQDLIKLRDKVASGKAERFDPLFEIALYPLKNDMKIVYLANDANLAQDRTEGSLDAAVAFLGAVLPTFAINRISTWPNANARAEIWGTHVDNCERWHHHSDGRFKAEADTPARALLLATLDALIARAE